MAAQTKIKLEAANDFNEDRSVGEPKGRRLATNRNIDRRLHHILELFVNGSSKIMPLTIKSSGNHRSLRAQHRVCLKLWALSDWFLGRSQKRRIRKSKRSFSLLFRER